MTKPSFQAIPIFRIHSVEEAKNFYCEYLGFNLDWEHYYEPNAPVYMQVSYHGMRLQLSANERFRPASAVFIETVGINTFHAQLKAQSTQYEIPEVTISPWNTQQMEFEDPFGNLLRFHEALT